MAQQPAVTICDRDADVRRLAECELKRAGIECRWFDTLDRALPALADKSCCCLVLDLYLEERCGVSLLRELQSRDSDLPIIVTAASPSAADAIEAFQAGAYRVFEKPLAASAFVAAVTEAVALCQSRRRRRWQTEKRLGGLSPREREVLDLLLRGMPAKQIARELQISPSTVEKHRARILEKSQTDSLIQLAHFLWTGPEQGIPEPHFHVRRDASRRGRSRTIAE